MNEEYLKERTKEELIEMLVNEIDATRELLNNWNELKKWLDQEYEHCDKIGNPAIGYAMGQIRRVKSKMQELENKEEK